MSQFFKINSDNPQQRLVRQAVDILKEGGVIAYPTDSGYALGCQIGNKEALGRICRIRQLDERHNFTIICRDLSQVGEYAHFDTPVFRLIKSNTPGAYTFILKATREVPRRLMHPKRKTIGIRIPDNAIAQALVDELHEPMMTTTLILPGDQYSLTDPVEIRHRLEKEIELVIDGGYGDLRPTTLIDFVDGEPTIVRQGKGDIAPFQADQ
jgi:tRNA threonylcarbamoyl adenosine modification protein (Sua5/YciO/YrdC/YwlC family)